jgi:general stress protein 26
MNPIVDTDKARETLWNLIKDIKFGMFTHQHGQGMLHSAPLTTQNKKLDEGSELYFFVPRNGDIAKCIATHSLVNVSYTDTHKDSYVSVSGQASVREDMAKKEALFTAFAKAWFPGGSADPNMALLVVKIDHAEYWDVKENQMVQLFEMAKAAITGKPLKDMGEHAELKLS